MRHEVHQSSTLEYLALYPDDYQDQAAYPLVIWLHGFGADMNDLAPLAKTVHSSGYVHVLPNAPLGGFDGPEGTVRAWFERGGKERPEGVRLALAALDAFLVDVLARFRVQVGRAVLVGFSQGANLALRYCLSRPEMFAGVAALSCSLRRADDLLADLPVERSMPIFLAHGIADSMVPVEWGRRMAEFLREQGFSPIYQEYPMGHEISETLLAELTGWITKTLVPRSPGS